MGVHILYSPWSTECTAGANHLLVLDRGECASKGRDHLLVLGGGFYAENFYPGEFLRRALLVVGVCFLPKALRSLFLRARLDHVPLSLYVLSTYMYAINA